MAAGQLYIKPSGSNQWLDAYETWGVSFEHEGVENLMAFAPNKEPVVNKNPTAPGAEVVATTVGITDERTASILMHIVASSKADFLHKKSAFYAAIKGGAIQVKYVDDKVWNATNNELVQVVHTMYYVACTQYTQFLSGMAKFLLNLYEPMPGN